MDTVLSLHRADGVQIDSTSCSDDWPSTAPGACTANDSGLPRDSAIEVPVIGGNSVYVRVSRYGASYGGRFVLNHAFVPEPGFGMGLLAGVVLLATRRRQRFA